MRNSDKELLRLSTVGSVDDGKSTLIGRLLHDTRSVFADQMSQVAKSSEKKGLGHIDFSLFTDGLKAEREQGITIDVAYRYFETEKRKFILADTPGHFEYTRNMVTGASTANVALILVDAENGIVEQTRRHVYLTSLLQIPHLILCVNKMDKIGFDRSVFEKIVKDFKTFSTKLNINDIHFVPISALQGDNVVLRSAKMPWYDGATLLYTLENIHIASDHNHIDGRFPVQLLISPDNLLAGRIASGVFRPGDDVIVLPQGKTTHIKSIDQAGKELDEAFAPMSVTMRLEDRIDTKRGDMVARVNNQPKISDELDMMLCWLDNAPYDPKKKYKTRLSLQETSLNISGIVYKIDINTLSRVADDPEIRMNDIVRIRAKAKKPVCYDIYRRNRLTGSLILIDESTGATVAAGILI